MELVPPRGTQDLLPSRGDAMLGLYDEAHRAAGLFGYRYVETPTFEHTELFVRTSGETSDVVTKEMYTFEDKGGRLVTLRPESTAGVVRAYLTNAQSLPNPFKAYYVASEFRHGRPQAGRMREFRQFGIEVIGAAAPGADVEVIVLGDRFLRDRGLRDVALHLNSIGDRVCRPGYRELLVDYFAPFRDRLDEDCRVRLDRNPLRVFDCKVDGDKDFVRAAPSIADHLCEPCATHFAAVRAGLDDAGVRYELDPRLVRGLDYYTRTAFEWISGALSSSGASAASTASTVNAGGRYDGLAEALGGPPTPGVGFAMGLDRVVLAMEGEGLAPPVVRTPRCFVVALGDAAAARARALVDDLRSAGVSADRAFEDRPLKAQLKMADRADAGFAAIIGERELAEGVVTLRRLVDGVQKTVASPDVVEWLARLDDRADEPA
ncbi:MAG: histidine--tRNA ligase [Actinomycetota bacterium]